jgi:hypothetical protein
MNESKKKTFRPGALPSAPLAQPQTPNKPSIPPLTLELESLQAHFPPKDLHFALHDSLTVSKAQLIPPTITHFDSLSDSISPFQELFAIKQPAPDFLSLADPDADADQAPEPDSGCDPKPEAKRRRRRRRTKNPKRDPLAADRLEDGQPDLQPRPSKHLGFAEERGASSQRKTKCASEPTTATEDSSSQNSFSFLGLTGNGANFRKAVCCACKNSKVAFSFGECAPKKRAEKYTCAECIKSSLGEDKYMTFFKLDASPGPKLSKGLAQVRSWAGFAEYLQHREKQDINLLALDFCLEDKKSHLHGLLTKMVHCLSAAKHKSDYDTCFLSFRFIHEAVSQLLRIADICALQTFDHKMDQLSSTEKAFYKLEVKRQLGTLAAADIERHASPARSKLLPALRQPSLLSLFENEDRGALGKRDSNFKFKFSELETDDFEADFFADTYFPLSLSHRF